MKNKKQLILFLDWLMCTIVSFGFQVIGNTIFPEMKNMGIITAITLSVALMFDYMKNDRR